MKSRRKSQSSSKRLSQTEKPSITDDELDELIANITLKRGRSAYGVYICEMLKKERESDEDFSLINTVKKYAPKWPKVSDKDREKYEKISQTEKEKYKRDLDTVKHYFFGFVKQGVTAYRLFLDKRLREAFENDEDPKEAKIQASKDWEELSAEERREWKNLQKENDSWWERAKHSKTINAYAVFVQKKMEEYRDNDETLNFKDCSKLWSKATDKEKRKYAKYAEALNDQRKRMRECYEIVKGIKPKKPMGAFKIFLQEKAQEGKFQGKNAFKEGKRLWEELTEDDKEKYLKKSHRIKICYLYKQMLYKKGIKKQLPSRPPSAYNLYIKDLKAENVPKGKTFLEYAHEKWEKLNDDDKEKYIKKAEKLRTVYEAEVKKFEGKVFNYPKKAKSAYQLFMSQRVVELKEEKPKVEVKKLFQQCAEEWNDISKEDKKKYEKLSKKDRTRFKSQTTEFEEKGYYTPSKGELKSQEKKRLSQSQKRKSQKASQSSKKDKK